MNTKRILSLSILVTGLLTSAGFSTLAGPLDPDCTPEKAVKGAAAKSAVGVGGRCSGSEAAKDTAKRKAGVDEKSAKGKKGNDKDGTDAAKGAVKKVVD